MGDQVQIAVVGGPIQQDGNTHVPLCSAALNSERAVLQSPNATMTELWVLPPLTNSWITIITSLQVVSRESRNVQPLYNIILVSGVG